MLFLISFLSNYHRRSSHFYYIIDQILLIFKDDFKKHLSNSEIFNIFYANKRLILFLLKNQILHLDPKFARVSDFQIDAKFPHYFFNELGSFFEEYLKREIEEELKKINQDSQDFQANRELGENETYLCQLIRNDLLDEFITYAHKINLPLKSKIKTSIFETNLFLIKNEPTIIEYAAFFGSIQIFNFLRLSGVELNSNLWLFAIHGDGEIIHLLEENSIKPPDNSYEKCFIESIKCHHNEMARYFLNNYLDQNIINEDESVLSQIIASYNYEFFPDDFSNEISFFTFCRMGNFTFAEYMLNTKSFDVDKKNKMHTDFDFVLSPFVVAIRNNQTNIVNLLIDRKDIDVNSIGTAFQFQEFEHTFTALNLLILWNDDKRVELLLHHPKIDVNIKCYEKSYGSNSVFIYDRIPIHEAINEQNLKIFKLLLSHKNIDVNQTLSHYSSINNNTLELEKEVSPLFHAIQKEDIEFVKLLLEHPKINVNLNSIIRDAGYQITTTSLCYSIKNKKDEITKLLLNHPNIDVNSKMLFKDSTYMEKSALYLAVEEKNEEVVKLLLSRQDIDINCHHLFQNSMKTQIKKTMILHKAIMNKNIEIIKLLLSNSKIDINLKSSERNTDKNGINEEEETTLGCAIKNGNVDIIKLLLSNPLIDFRLKSTTYLITQDSQHFEDKTPLQISIAKKNVGIFQLLFEYFIKNENPTKECLADLNKISDNDQIKAVISSYLK
ncbi:hypothetical protein M9Y10_040160 [Tritrichomonas musculus]|uniref:DUF3447 domain-containing protein n=1 Tax=Tritrichomonas musculus TaxID=1915356 RepID=A0ABR2GPU0_9EUKA